MEMQVNRFFCLIRSTFFSNAWKKAEPSANYFSNLWKAVLPLRREALCSDAVGSKPWKLFPFAFFALLSG